MTWEKIQTKGDIPAGVAAHSAVALGNTIYIFGGMTPEGASNSMYKFNTGKLWFLKETCPLWDMEISCHKMYKNKSASFQLIPSLKWF
jgi:hypothetical protein